MSKKAVVLFVFFSSVAILLVFFLNERAKIKIRGDKPADFVYAIENLDTFLNTNELNKASKYFDVLLNVQTLMTRRAEELYMAGVKDKKLVNYLILNDPSFMIRNGSSKEKALTLKILGILKGEKK